MKCVISAGAILIMILAGGCTVSTPATRIEQNRAAFSSWPPPVQEQVQQGRIAVGFTPDMVQVALGKPDRVRTVTTEKGRSEVWIYFDHGPHFSIGVGVGVSSRHSAYGGGTEIESGSDGEERLRVIFEGGNVSAIETRK